MGQTTDDPVRRLWPTSHDFLFAVDRYWGRHGWFLNPNVPTLAHAACPGCRSKVLTAFRGLDGEPYSVSQCYPLCVGGSGSSWWLIVTCRCEFDDIAAPLAAYEETQRALRIEEAA